MVGRLSFFLEREGTLAFKIKAREHAGDNGVKISGRVKT